MQSKYTPNTENLLHRKFNRLTAIGYAGKEKRKTHAALSISGCGNATAASLLLFATPMLSRVITCRADASAITKSVTELASMECLTPKNMTLGNTCANAATTPTSAVIANGAGAELLCAKGFMNSFTF